MKTYSSLNIERAIVSGFLSVILAGALFLQASYTIHGLELSTLDSIYMATSAVCVTGLSVLDVSAMPFAAQVVMLFLMEIGGIGVLTVTTALFYFVGLRVGVREGIFCAGGLGLDTPSGTGNLVRRVLTISLLIQCAAVIPLYFGFSHDFGTLDALWMAVFHSVSAFCNAGFSIAPGGTIEGYKYSFAVPGTIMVLITLGGTGFLVLYECFRLFMGKQKKLGPLAIMVLKINLFLVLGGAVIFFFAEGNFSMSGMDWGWRFWNSLFQSVTTRTAGFNTVKQTLLSDLGVFAACLLMLIGAAPGSTGGGIKTTTLGVLLLGVRSRSDNEPSIVFRNRAISSDNVYTAMTILMNYIIVIISAVLILSLTESVPFKAIIYEVISAIGTVGLSLNATAKISPFGHFVCILLMFWGRIGILTFISWLLGRKMERDNVTYIDVNIPVG